MNSHVKYIYLFISSFQVSVFLNGDTKRDLFDVISVDFYHWTLNIISQISIIGFELCHLSVDFYHWTSDIVLRI